jgi:UPF0271 protein
LVTEAFPDLDYNPDGTLIIERVKTARDPAQVAERAVRLVRERVVEATDGSLIDTDALTACIHGDAPNSVEIARAVRERLDAEGIEVRPVPQAE